MGIAGTKSKKSSAVVGKEIQGLVKKGIKTPMPSNIKPMLATLVEDPMDEPGWLYEVKWDGYRALAYLDYGVVDLKSRNNKSFNEKFYPVYEAMQEWKIQAIVDGEVIVVNEKGVADFGDLQNWRSEADGHLVFYAFDILFLEGYDLMKLPLSDRRIILQSVIKENATIKSSLNFNATGTEFFKIADQLGLEGIIAKKADSIYRPDYRSKDWLKIKTEKRQEAIIGGYTKNENTSKKFSALLLGIYEGKKFNFICPVGTGFSVQTQNDILEKLKPLKRASCPFSTVPDYNKPSRFRPNPPKAEVTWVEPKIVVEISYREETKDGAIRHPSFKGIREDKNPAEVVREKPVIIDSSKGEETLQKQNLIRKPGARERKTLLNPKEETQVRIINSHELKFTNLSKIYWPKEKLTKRDMLNYYYQVVPYMLPYMKDRPQTLNRHPHGITGETFYQKDVTGKVPTWVKKFPYHSETDGRDKNFMVATDEASLLYIASLGCIEMNPWHSRADSPDNPDWCIIDLDPDKNSFDQVIEAALVTKKILDAVDVPSYCKTSGSTGLHIYIPFGGKYSYEDSKEFGRVIVKLVHAEIPSYTSIERLTSNRKGKMYLDFLQNRPQATVAAPYSLRPKPGAPVSMPLDWLEVRKGLNITDFHMRNALPRLKETGDLFKGVLGKGINLQKVLKNIDSTFAVKPVKSKS